MSTSDTYVCNLDTMDWRVAQEFEADFRWEYDDGRDALLKLYRKGKRQQWDADTRIDWSQDLDPENPEQLPDESMPIFGSAIWNELDATRTSDTCASTSRPGSSRSSCTASRARSSAPRRSSSRCRSIDAKFYAATQVIDEARHVEAYSRLLHEKFELAYPINPT